MTTEFEFLANLKQRFKLTHIGDDCAVLPKDGETDQVITADMLIEDIDFRMSWTTAKFLGHKTLAVSLSDIAAMGAVPAWAMLSIGVPETVWNTSFLEEFYEGWFDLAAGFGIELIGGDISKTPDKIVIDSIAGGQVTKGKAVLRKGANAGDLIFVSGSLGGASAGLRILEAGKSFSEETPETENLKMRLLKPTPKLELGVRLRQENIVSSMIDISDGLSSDLFHLCRSSGKGAVIEEDQIPIDENIRKSESLRSDAQKFALNGGEDFELLFTADARHSEKISKEIATELGLKISCIGKITESPEIIELISADRIVTVSPSGFQHFGGQV